MARAFRSVHSALVPSATSEGAGGAGGPDAAAFEALEQRSAERLLDDEALRADLTDDEFQPLQDWALERIHEHVATLANPDSTAAETEMAAVVELLRRVLGAANDTIGRRFDLDAQAFLDGFAPLVEALKPPLYGAEGPAHEAALAVGAVLPDLAARKDEADGVGLVEALVAALRERTTSPHPDSQEETGSA